MTKIQIVTLFLFSASLCHAARFKASFLKHIDETYMDENAVFLYKNRELTIDIVDDSLCITEINSEATYIMNAYSKIGAIKRIYYSDFYSVGKIDAATYYPGSGGYKKIVAKDIRTTNTTDGSVFFDDSKQIEITYPMVNKGTVTTLDYEEFINDGHFMDVFYFQTRIPAHELNLTVKVHKDIDVNFRTFNFNGFNIEKECRKKGNYVIYKWFVKRMNEYKPGNVHAGLKHFVPHVYAVIEKVKYKTHTETFFRNTDDLFSYYNQFIEKVDTICNADFKSKVSQITAEAELANSKAKAIQYWIQDNIKYIAFEDGYRGFIPHGPQSIFDKRYGDCKDMTSITVAMMKQAGLPCYYGWVGTRDLPYTYEALPTLAADNHMVAVYMEKDSFVVMDGTMDLSQFGFVPHHIQGKEILVRLSDTEYVIHKLPVTPFSKNRLTTDIHILLDGTAVNASGKNRYIGYNRYEIANALDAVKPDRMLKALSKNLSVGNNTFKLNDYNLSDITNRDEPIEISYDFSVSDYVQNIGDQIFVNLNLNRRFAELKLDTTESSRPVGNDFKFEENNTITLDVPVGYKVSYIPEDMNYKCEEFSFSISYESGDGFIRQNKTITLNILDILPMHYEKWDAMIKELNKAYHQAAGLEKIKNQIP